MVNRSSLSRVHKVMLLGITFPWFLAKTFSSPTSLKSGSYRYSINDNAATSLIFWNLAQSGLARRGQGICLNMFTNFYVVA